MKGTVEGNFVRTFNGGIYKLSENDVSLGTENPLIKKSGSKLEDLMEIMDVLMIDISPEKDSEGIVVPRIAETAADLQAISKRLESGDWVLKGIAPYEQVYAATFYNSDEPKEEETKK